MLNVGLVNRYIGTICEKNCISCNARINEDNLSILIDEESIILTHETCGNSFIYATPLNDEDDDGDGNIPSSTEPPSPIFPFGNSCVEFVNAYNRIREYENWQV